MSTSLYDQDFVRWAEQQAIAIREAGSSGANLPIDWKNVAEEIESLGRSDRRELGSRIATIIEHLLKLQSSPAEGPRRGWVETASVQRREIARLSKDSPSLRDEVATAIAEELPAIRDEVRKSLALWGASPRVDLEALGYTQSQVLGDWLPEIPSPVSRATGKRRRERNR